MGLFNRKKKRRITKIIELRMHILIRQMIYDSIFDDPEHIADSMGLPPISKEVSEMEDRASVERLRAFAALVPFLESHADIAARIAATAYNLETVDDGLLDGILEEEHLETITSLFRLVSLSSSVSAISTLMDLGLLDTEVRIDE
jgi:hypothetical protein